MARRCFYGDAFERFFYGETFEKVSPHPFKTFTTFIQHPRRNAFQTIPPRVLCVLVKALVQYSVSDVQALERRRNNSSRKRLGPTTAIRSQKLVCLRNNAECASIPRFAFRIPNSTFRTDHTDAMRLEARRLYSVGVNPTRALKTLEK